MNMVLKKARKGAGNSHSELSLILVYRGCHLTRRCEATLQRRSLVTYWNLSHENGADRDE